MHGIITKTSSSSACDDCTAAASGRGQAPAVAPAPAPPSTAAAAALPQRDDQPLSVQQMVPPDQLNDPLLQPDLDRLIGKHLRPTAGDAGAFQRLQAAAWWWWLLSACASAAHPTLYHHPYAPPSLHLHTRTVAFSCVVMAAPAARGGGRGDQNDDVLYSWPPESPRVLLLGDPLVSHASVLAAALFWVAGGRGLLYGLGAGPGAGVCVV